MSIPLMVQTLLVFLVLLFRWKLNGKTALNDALQLGIIAALKHCKDILISIRWVEAWIFATPALIFVEAATILGSISWFSRSLFHSFPAEENVKSGKRLPPLLFPCRTSHTRLYPRVHSFSYSYLYAGVPVGWKGRVGTLLSADNAANRTQPRSWFSVEAEDYLARGTHVDGLAGKLRDYLETQNVHHRNYTHAYLVTAPRFLGYSFNPVSYWYLYDDKVRLSAMILEVNNTFDERRMYLLLRDSSDQAESSAPESTASFSQAWSKDFHVSPFNDRQGSYSLKATDPFATSGTAKLDNNITLSSADGKPKLVARVFSSAEPVHPRSLSQIDVLRFLCAWWWVGLTTDLRILREARKLWSKGLQVFYRPEVLVSSIGRRAAVEEEIVECYFRTWLKKAVDASPKRMSVRYTASLNAVSTEFFPPKNHEDIDTNATLHLKILSPAFYRCLVYATSMENVFDDTYFSAADFEKLVFISDDATLKELLLHSPPFRPSLSPGITSRLPLQLFQDYVFGIVQRANAPSAYQKAALEIWLSDKLFFGNIALLNLCVKFLWLGWLYFCLGVIEELLSTAIGYALGA